MNLRRIFLTLVTLAVLVISVSAQKSVTDQGFDLYQSGNYEEAAKILERAKQDDPEDRNAQTYLGGAYLHLKKRSQANTAFRQAYDGRSFKFVAAETPDTEKYKLISRPRPSVTGEMRGKYRNGQAWVAVELRNDGAIGFAHVFFSTAPEWEPELIKAARGTTFTPESRNGTPVTVIVFIEYTFQLF